MSVRSIIESGLHFRRVWVAGLICGLLILLAFSGAVRKVLRTNDLMTLPADTVAERSSPDDELGLQLVFPPKLKPTMVFNGDFEASPQIVAIPGRAPFVVVACSDGTIAALELGSGKVIWQVRLPADPGHDLYLEPTPVQVGDRLAGC